MRYHQRQQIMNDNMNRRVNARALFQQQAHQRKGIYDRLSSPDDDQMSSNRRLINKFLGSVVKVPPKSDEVEALTASPRHKPKPMVYL